VVPRGPRRSGVGDGPTPRWVAEQLAGDLDELIEGLEGEKLLADAEGLGEAGALLREDRAARAGSLEDSAVDPENSAGCKLLRTTRALRKTLDFSSRVTLLP